MKYLQLIFFFILYKDCRADNECDKKWPRCGETENIVCEKGGKCDPDPNSLCIPLTNDNNFRDWIVEVHNRYRNQIASGVDKWNGAGPAKNMRVINYDLDLEYTASCTANTCVPAAHACSRTTKFWQNGQSIQIVTGQEEAILAIPYQWYSRITEMKADDFDDFHQKNDLPLSFTQMIWADTTHIGCAKAYSSKEKKNILVCNYGPPGNVHGHSIMERGEPASNCPPEAPRSLEYTALCGKSDRFSQRLEKRAVSNGAENIQVSNNITIAIVCFSNIFVLICLPLLYKM